MGGLRGEGQSACRQRRRRWEEASASAAAGPCGGSARCCHHKLLEKCPPGHVELPWLPLTLPVQLFTMIAGPLAALTIDVLRFRRVDAALLLLAHRATVPGRWLASAILAAIGAVVSRALLVGYARYKCESHFVIESSDDGTAQLRFFCCGPACPPPASQPPFSNI